MQRPWLDADRIGERLRRSAERVDPVRDRDDAIALLLSGVADAGELRRIGGLRRDRGQGGEDVRTVADVRAKPVQVAPADACLAKSYVPPPKKRSIPQPTSEFRKTARASFAGPGASALRLPF